MSGGRPLAVLQPGDPEEIGSYLIRARVGAGGMGVVYLAEAANGRSVAIKVIQAALAHDPVFRDRFRREVAAARRVRSRVTVAVLDADADAQCPWVAFEYVDGPNLQEVVDAGIPRLSATIGILTGIAEALVAIHQVGIIHRDLKPSNVLCPPDGVKVIDFGIAAALEATSTTKTGLLGTPAWLSPEQVTGQRLTAAVDVFAWGCIALYTLTGRLAFGGGEESPPALIYRVVNVDPDLSGVPDELIDPVSAALAKQPEDRPEVSEILRMMLPSRRLDPPAYGAHLREHDSEARYQRPASAETSSSAETVLPLAVAVPGWQGSTGGNTPAAPGSTGGPTGSDGRWWPPGGPGDPTPPHPPMVPLSGPPPAGWTVPVAPGWPGRPPPGPPGPAGPPGPRSPAGPPPGGSGAGWSQPGPPGWVAPPGGPGRKKNGRLAWAIGIPVAVIIVIVVIAVIAASSSPSPKPLVGPPNSSTTTTGSASTSTSTGVTTPSGVAPLAQLLPHDVDSFADCSQNKSPPNLTGLSNALVCSPKNLTGGQIFAFQFDSAADYTTSLAFLNKFKGFDPATAGSSCPPGADSQDSIGWHSSSFPSRPGQILECLSVGTSNSQPDYIWTYPTEHVIIDAQAAEHSTFADLDSWWTKDAPPP